MRAGLTRVADRNGAHAGPKRFRQLISASQSCLVTIDGEQGFWSIPDIGRVVGVVPIPPYQGLFTPSARNLLASGSLVAVGSKHEARSHTKPAAARSVRSANSALPQGLQMGDLGDYRTWAASRRYKELRRPPRVVMSGPVTVAWGSAMMR